MFHRTLRGVGLWVIILISALTLLPERISAGSPLLVLRVNDTVAYLNHEGAVTVFLTNYQDTVASFELWLRLNRPDLVYFPSVRDTVPDTSYWRCRQYAGPHCIDSEAVVPGQPFEWMVVDTSTRFLASLDTAGTSISGWEYVSAVTLSYGSDVKVTAMSDTGNPSVRPSLSPSDVGRVLFRLPFRVLAVVDTLSERTAVVSIDIDSGEEFRFNRPDSTAICWPLDPLDTIPCLRLINGSITVERCQPIPRPGDANGDSTVTAADLAAIEQYIRTGAPPLAAPSCADLNGDCCIDSTDLRLFDTFFILGQPVNFAQCVCPEPSRCCCLGIRGNVDGDEADLCDVSDLSVLVDYLFFGAAPLVCADEADFDASTSVDISDLSSMVDFLFFGGSPASPCL